MPLALQLACNRLQWQHRQSAINVLKHLFFFNSVQCQIYKLTWIGCKQAKWYKPQWLSESQGENTKDDKKRTRQELLFVWAIKTASRHSLAFMHSSFKWPLTLAKQLNQANRILNIGYYGPSGILLLLPFIFYQQILHVSSVNVLLILL